MDKDLNNLLKDVATALIDKSIKEQEKFVYVSIGVGSMNSSKNLEKYTDTKLARELYKKCEANLFYTCQINNIPITFTAIAEEDNGYRNITFRIVEIKIINII
jgi:hypothetical protein